MVTYQLDTFLSGHAFAFAFIFSRIGTLVMLMPGIGENYVPVRVRLMLALSLSFLLMPALMPRLPPLPREVPTLLSMVSFEIVVGLFFGTLLRLIMDALETAGSIIALQTGLSNATVFNPALAAQSPLPSALLGVSGSTLIFVTGLDYYLFHCLVATYDIFPPGSAYVPGDMAQIVGQSMGKSFNIGIQMAMPFLFLGLLMFLALGMIQKLMSQVQLFMITMPGQIWGGLFLISITLSSILTAWLHYFDTSLSLYFSL